MPRGRLGVGFIGSGFITRFHIKSWIAVRDADVRGVWSPHAGHAEEAAALARSLRVGEARAFASIEEMVAAPEIDCIWICGPNQARLENMERIVDALGRGAKLVGIACEKPLARNGAEARRMVELAEKAGVLHGYLESQLFSPVLERGRGRPRWLPCSPPAHGWDRRSRCSRSRARTPSPRWRRRRAPRPRAGSGPGPPLPPRGRRLGSTPRARPRRGRRSRSGCGSA